ncbi:FK506-binding protein 5-like [Centropristis striata]|uniref:FK506-binding protein 5-like n=1 Tax=Centropristis striata TaxID=184440 RepID=UPI0027DF02C5|nr:FK506-binding protein 5-like [Centropristis striata]
MEQEVSSASCPAESGGTVFLQLLEFKAHLLEAVEELHIHRDAETRFEDQISKLVLDKQELEWEKESLQNQIETEAKQHSESLSDVKKQFQAQIRASEEEKGKYQVSAELKDKEMNNLKEELKALQLLKYNLEKKSSELEQKLSLQSRSKDSQLKQLGEVEKRFSAVSRQCASVKQAHHTLEHNVDEAMKINKKLTTANEKQEATIVSLKKELDEVYNQLMKAKMAPVRQEQVLSPAGREQQVQHLIHRLNMETEMNKKLREENVAVISEKQEVLVSLQQAQQLLLTQTQTVSRAELQIQTQREQNQALKQEQRAMQEKTRAIEEELAELMESYAAAQSSWDKEKSVFVCCMEREQQEVKAVKQAHDELHQEHAELSSQARGQPQHMQQIEMRGSSQRGVSTEICHSVEEELRGEETVHEATSSSELTSFSSVQHLASSQSRTPDGLQDSAAVTELGPSGASTVSRPGDHSHGPADSLSKLQTDEGNRGMRENHDGKLVENKREAGESNEEQQGNRPEIQGEDEDDAGEQRGQPDRPEDSQGTAQNTGDLKQAGTGTHDRAAGGGTCGLEQRGKTGQHTAERQIAAQTADRTTEEISTQPGIDSRDSQTLEASQRHEDSRDSQTLEASQRHEDSRHENKGHETRREPQTFSSDQHQRLHQGPNSVIQAVIDSCYTESGQTGKHESGQTGKHESGQTGKHESAQTGKHESGQTGKHESGQTGKHESGQTGKHEEHMEEKPSNTPTTSTDPPGPLNLSSVWSSPTSTAPVAAQSGGTVTIQEFEATTTTTTTTTEPSKLSDVTEVLPQRGQLKSLLAGGEDVSSRYREIEGELNIDTYENAACEKTQEPLETSDLKNICAEITLDPESQTETGRGQENLKNDKIEDAVDSNKTKSETALKPAAHPSHESNASSETSSAACYQQSPAEETLLGDTNDSSLLSNKTYRSSFDWSSAQRQTGSSRAESDLSILHHFVQGSSLSERNTSDPGGLRPAPNTIPTFLRRNKHSKVPLVISRASDLLEASRVSGTPAASRRPQQGPGASCRDTASRSLSITSPPVSASISASRLSWQTAPGCSRAPGSALAAGSDSDRLSGSQEREDQQSSLRAQISKIEQFLSTERLRLPKRRKTDN